MGITADTLYIHMIFLHACVDDGGVVIITNLSYEGYFIAELCSPNSLIGPLPSRYYGVFACADCSSWLGQFIYIQSNIDIDAAYDDDFLCMGRKWNIDTAGVFQWIGGGKYGSGRSFLFAFLNEAFADKGTEFIVGYLDAGDFRNCLLYTSRCV